MKRRRNTAKTANMITAVAHVLEVPRLKAKQIIDAVGQSMREAVLRGDHRIHLDGIGSVKWTFQEGYLGTGNLFTKYSSTKRPRKVCALPNYVQFPDRRDFYFHISDAMTPLLNENYKGLDTLEEIYADNQSRSR